MVDEVSCELLSELHQTELPRFSMFPNFPTAAYPIPEPRRPRQSSGSEWVTGWVGSWLGFAELL